MVAFEYRSISSCILKQRLWVLSLMLATSVPACAYSQGLFVKKIRVQRPSQLDWPYVLEQVHRGDPTPRIEKYNPRRQTYDLFGPRVAPARELPLILFISPGNAPLEWTHFSPACRKHGILFAGVRAAGNGQDASVRVRAAVEVLDDVRRRYRVDPDRTYVAGFSGGAVIASRLAFAIPECFGGLLCIGQRVILPNNSPRMVALPDRAGERIQIAALCGGNEVVGPDVEHVDVAVARAAGFRCRAFITRRGGHRMPDAAVIEQAIKWLEDGSEGRQLLAQQYPATRLVAGREYDATAWQDALVEEANARWAAQEYGTALRLLQWIEARWPESPAAALAKTKSQTFEQQQELVESASKELAERQSRINEARIAGYEKLANDRRSWFTRETRSQYAEKAMRLIEVLGGELDDSSKRIETLKEIANRGAH